MMHIYNHNNKSNLNIHKMFPKELMLTKKTHKYSLIFMTFNLKAAIVLCFPHKR